MFVIADLARHLLDNGYQVELATSSGHKLRNGIFGDLPVTCVESLKLDADDRWIVPEGWPNALTYGLAAKAQCCVYAQAWSYLHGNLPPNVHWRQLPVRMMAVSDPTALFVYETIGICAPVIRPSINPEIFHSKGRKENGKIHIAWMPRKNKGLAKQIQIAWTARTATFGLPEVEWVDISDCERAEVARRMRDCHIFMATSFPEGFGLSPLEAMACGCLVAGYAGMGGWDYMRQALPGGYVPAFPLREVPWGANGFYAADGDALGALLCLEAAVIAAKEKNGTSAAIRAQASKAAAWYSPQRQARRVIELWQDDDFWSTRKSMSQQRS